LSISGHLGKAFLSSNGIHVEGVFGSAVFFWFYLLLIILYVITELLGLIPIIYHLVLSRLGRILWLVRHGNAGRLKRTEHIFIKKEMALFPMIIFFLVS
jgi:hypothetical protein